MYNTILGLMDIYSADPVKKYLMVLLLWLFFWPGGMFLIGLVGEKRLVPIWKHQARAFLPGEMMFSIIVVAFGGVFSTITTRTGTIMLEKSANSVWLLLPAFIVALIVYFFLHNREKGCYEIRALYSPTKIAHDIVGYILIPQVLISFLTIVIDVARRYYCFAKERMPEAALKNLAVLWQVSWPYWIVIVAAIVVYIGCLIYDIRHPATPEDIIARHPADWQPLWRR
ncbi:hypothetical protein [Candidatus Nanosyncoccus alces]|uniref:Uncharacterized protein n=1 Tax=Candidatus Nanosyncoccus alces TaxID=2171997 RepID=A0ABY0FLA8_9BACT|nr:hypothetical protein [Candidatus Nanosyncoccus alces]RYC74549.1 hypothetical protein G3RUM_00706 [Candidatus Nanosyncoccus alces]